MNKKSIKIYLERVKLLSKIILKSDFPAFWERVEALWDHEEFYFEDRDEVDEECVDYYLNPYLKPYDEESLDGVLWRGDISYFPFERYLLDNAEDEEGLNRLLSLHWGGEHKEGDFARFVQRSLCFHGIMDFDIGFWKEMSDEIIDEIEFKKGDYLLYQFDIFDKELRGIGFYLVFAYYCYDTHYPIVVNQEEYNKLNGLRVGSLEILDCERLIARLG